MKLAAKLLAWVCIGALGVSCGGGVSGGIVVSDAWARTSPTPGTAGAAYMMITNDGSADDRLLSASSDIAMQVKLHETKDNNGVMEMSPADGITIPANGQAELKPGSYHMMLIGLKQELKAGEKITLTLNFEKAGAIAVTAEVRDP